MTQEAIYAGLTLLTAPAAEPLSLADAQAHLRVSTSTDASYITALIGLARQHCQNITRRAFLTQTWKLSLRSWPGRDYSNWPSAAAASAFESYNKFNFIKVPLPPLVSVASIVYTDTAGTPTTMPSGNIAGGYNVITTFEPGRIVLPFSQIWPTTILLPGAPIDITFTCGYADLNTFNAKFEGAALVIHAMKLLIGGWYEFRLEEPVDTGTFSAVDRLLASHRIYE